MTERSRGAGPAGDAVGVSPAGAAAAGRPPTAPWWGVASPPAGGAVTGWLGRLGTALRRPEPAPAPVVRGGMTVADLVSARGLAGPPPASDTAAAAPTDAPPAEPPAPATPAEPAVTAEPAAEPVGVEPDAADRGEPDREPDRGDSGHGLSRAAALVVAVPEPLVLTAQPSDPDLLAPPWIRASPDVVDADPEPDPAGATDRLSRPLRAVIAPAPSPPRTSPAPAAAPAAPGDTPVIPVAAPAPPAVGRPTRFSVAPRPPVVDDLAITGLTRRSRSRWGSRLFALFFAFVYLTILVQLIDSLLHPVYR